MLESKMQAASVAIISKKTKKSQLAILNENIALLHYSTYAFIR